VAEHVDQGVQAEFVDLAAQQIVEARLIDSEPFCCFSLSQSARGVAHTGH